MKTASRYEETQMAVAMPWVVCGILLAAMVIGVAAAGEWLVLLAFLPVFAVIVALMLAFGRLDVTVGAGNLEWAFRWGVWRKRVALRDVATVRATRVPWWYGWGVSLTPRGWLYNVRGRGAVAVTARSGRTVLIGSDRPERLAEAIAVRAGL